MSQAITTRFLPPTDRRGSRVKARAYAGSKTYSWQSELGTEENHERAATLFAAEKGWLKTHRKMIGGQTHTGEYCFVLES